MDREIRAERGCTLATLSLSDHVVAGSAGIEFLQDIVYKVIKWQGGAFRISFYSQSRSESAVFISCNFL